MATWLESLTSTPEDMADFQRERVMLDATETVCRLMQEQGVSRAELASRLGKSRAHVTQLLSGRTNMTLRTLSDVLCALGRSLRIGDGPLSLGAEVVSPTFVVAGWARVQPRAIIVASPAVSDENGGGRPFPKRVA